VEIKCQLDATEVFIADLIASNACTCPSLPHSYNYTLQPGYLTPQTETTKLYTTKNLPRTRTRGPHNTRHTL